MMRDDLANGAVCINYKSVLVAKKKNVVAASESAQLKMVLKNPFTFPIKP